MSNKFINWIQHTFFYSSTEEYKQAMKIQEHNEDRTLRLCIALKEMYEGWNNILKQNQLDIENKIYIEYFGRTQEKDEVNLNACIKSHEEDLKNKEKEEVKK
jgi:hypothetical protein